MYTKEGYVNKGYYLPPETYISIFYVINLTCYLVRGVSPTCNHTLWCDDLQ